MNTRASIQIRPSTGAVNSKQAHTVRFVSSNNRTLAHNEYPTRAAAERAAKAWVVAMRDILTQHDQDPTP